MPAGHLRNKDRDWMIALLSPTTILNVIARLGKPSQCREIPYGRHNRQVLDIYRPAVSEPAPIIVFFYGGGWEDGNRADYYFVGAALAKQGFVTVVPDYRVYPEVRFPTFLKDAAHAVRWAREHAAEYGGDPRRIVLMGHSSGAHIAAMLTFDHRWLDAVGIDAGIDVAGMVGLAGPYDFLPLHSETLRQIFGPDSSLAATQPINFVEAGTPPILLASGRADDRVDPGNSSRLADRVRGNGGNAEVRFYPHVGHRVLIGAFAAPLRLLAPVLRDVSEFIRQVPVRACGRDASRQLSGVCG